MKVPLDNWVQPGSAQTQTSHKGGAISQYSKPSYIAASTSPAGDLSTWHDAIYAPVTLRKAYQKLNTALDLPGTHLYVEECRPIQIVASDC
jgi:hypothetical protein